MIKLSVSFEYECENEKAAIDMVEQLMRQTIDWTNKGLVLINTTTSLPR
jgi:hypothetical protein